MKLRRTIRYWILSRLKPCCEVVQLMSESMEDPLSIRDRLELRVHMIVCKWCALYLRHIKQLRTALRMVPVATDRALTSAARKKISDALKSDGASKETSSSC